MRSQFAVLLCTLFSLVPVILVAPHARAAESPKDWTVLVFLNGKNSLDSYGPKDINEMEKVGSTASTNVVVQWASTSAHTTKRILVQKDANPSQVTSPVIQDMGKVDMGDWRSLVEFVKWGAANYPAKHYFVDVWDHGSGWHFAGAMAANGAILSPSDISWDDETGSFMTTAQLGQALRESAAAIGQKIDIYGSDAA